MNTRVPEPDRGMRKAPRQQRSRAMVELILQGATRVLAQTGWAKFTTNEVARIAGISVGSLYQYFPNKLALAEAIRRQHLEDLLAVFTENARRTTSQGEGESLQMRVTHLIDGIVAAHLINPTLHRVLLDEVPLAGREAHQDFLSQYMDFYRNFVSEVPGMAVERIGVVSRVLASAVEGVVHDASRRGELSSAALRNELNRLVYSWLSS